MMKPLMTPLLLAIAMTTTLVTMSLAIGAEIRQWSDPSGKYSVEAELLIADEDVVVLEQEDGEVVALKRKQLSESDRQFVDKQYPTENLPSKIDVDSKWKLSDGEVIAGRLMGFGRQDLNIKRERGDLWVNDRALKELPAAYHKIIPNIVSAIDAVKLETLEETEEHLADQGGGPYKYTVEGIQLDLKDWGVITVPLALLTTEEAKEIAPGFERWQAAQAEEVSDDDRYATEARERLALSSRDRLRRMERPMGERKMQWMELSMLAAGAGVTDVWEVAIFPPNRYGYGQRVLVSAENSGLARLQVAKKYPGWRIGPIAKRSY